MNVCTDRAHIPAGRVVTRYLTITLTAPPREQQRDRPAVQVALVLDRSGSMAGRKIEMARRAVEHAIRLLDTRDRLALVCYDTEVDTLLGATMATAEAKKRALDQLGTIDARGGTDLCGGWLRGASELTAPVTADNLRRVLLLSDGQANHGETDPDTLAQHARILRDQGIATSTFGIGADFDEVLMSRLATEGGGHFYYIETPAQIPDFLASELGDTLDVVAPDARVVVSAGAGVSVECLSGFGTEEEGAGRAGAGRPGSGRAGSGRTGAGRAGAGGAVGGAVGGAEMNVRLGDLVSGQEVTVILAVRITPGASTSPVVSLRLTDRNAALFAQPMTMEWEVVSDEVDASQAVNIEVLEAVATAMADRARTEALGANRRGNFSEAEAILNRAAEEIRALAPGAPSLDRIATELEGRLEEFTAVMSAMELKTAHYSAYASSQDRTAEGKPRRGR